MRLIWTTLLMALLLAVSPVALANTTWYVNGTTGSDSNNCMSPTTPCKTIGHAISLAASGDSISVAPATYTENVTIGVSLNVTGSGAATTIIDGGGVSTVATISSSAEVALSKFTIQNGAALNGAGIYNEGTLKIDNSTIRGNTASPYGGGIYNTGTLTINKSSVSGNHAIYGGGIDNFGALTINGSTISNNFAVFCADLICKGFGGGIDNDSGATIGTLTINNSTISGNDAGGGLINQGVGGGIYDIGLSLAISNSTISSNFAVDGGGIEGSFTLTPVTFQNSIVASNSGGNCSGTTITSNGYNLSSDGFCNFNNTGDLNNTDPKLGPLQNNGGPTQTQALLPGSPAIDAGNPSGCTDDNGNLLKTDQRGKPRPDKEDTGGCDMGAYERQSN